MFPGVSIAHTGHARLASAKSLLLQTTCHRILLRNTVTDALQFGYTVFILEDAIQAINLQPEDGVLALDAMIRFGAKLIHFK